MGPDPDPDYLLSRSFLSVLASTAVLHRHVTSALVCLSCLPLHWR